MGQTLLYGILIAIPTVVVAGPIFARTVKRMKPDIPDTFTAEPIPEDKLPSLGISIFSSLLPVILLTLTTVLNGAVTEKGPLKSVIVFISDPAIVMILSLEVATYTLGLRMKFSMPKVIGIYAEAVKDIGMLLLIMSGAGALKQILVSSGVSQEIVTLLSGVDIHPLMLGWFIACAIRVCVGSATVAGLTAASIMLPMINLPGVDPNLMVLSIGAGSLMFSHVNDAGFWLFKEYFNLSIKDTILSWSLMETIVAIVGIIGVMTVHYLRVLV